MGNYCIKSMYKKMPVSEKCPYCKKQRFIGGDETAFRISIHGCKICRLKKKYFHPSGIKEVYIESVKINKGRY